MAAFAPNATIGGNSTSAAANTATTSKQLAQGGTTNTGNGLSNIIPGIESFLVSWGSSALFIIVGVLLAAAGLFALVLNSGE